MGTPHGSTTLYPYCGKCKVQRELTQAQQTITLAGRVAVIGTCAVCGCGLYKAGATLPPCDSMHSPAHRARAPTSRVAQRRQQY